MVYDFEEYDPLYTAKGQGSRIRAAKKRAAKKTKDHENTIKRLHGELADAEQKHAKHLQDQAAKEKAAQQKAAAAAKKKEGAKIPENLEGVTAKWQDSKGVVHDVEVLGYDDKGIKARISFMKKIFRNVPFAKLSDRSDETDEERQFREYKESVRDDGGMSNEQWEQMMAETHEPTKSKSMPTASVAPSAPVHVPNPFLVQN